MVNPNDPSSPNNNNQQHNDWSSLSSDPDLIKKTFIFGESSVNDFNKDQTNATSPETSPQEEIFDSFEVGPGLTIKDEFERLTGEKWNGKDGSDNYIVESDGAYDANGEDDYPIERWVIKKRVKETSNTTSPETSQQEDFDPYAAFYDQGDDDPTKEFIDNYPSDDNVTNKDPRRPEFDWSYIDAYLNGHPDDKKPGKNPNKVKIGDIDITGIERAFTEDRSQRLKQLEESLKKLTPNIAELYARNRRLIVGTENRVAFQKAQGEYGEVLDEYLKLKAKETYRERQQEIFDTIERRIEELKLQIEKGLIEFAGGDLNNTEKTQEEMNAKKDQLVKEAEKILRQKYGDLTEALKREINADFINDYIRQEAALEAATVDKLNNGTTCRRIVHKIINNKVLKGALIAAAVAGLAATGIGLATGAVAVGMAFTAGGVAAGAAKGALMGGLMSRQDASNSAVNKFIKEENIRKQLGEINILEQDESTANVAEWLIEQYAKANEDDARSNRKRTLVSAGIGAAFGALMSGLQFGINDSTVQTSQEIVGQNPVEYHATNLDNVNIAPGHGAYDTFVQLGGDPAKYDQFEQIMFSLDPKYGLSPGSNGETAGFNGIVGAYAHTYPGKISTWPAAAQQYITEVANEAARQGLIPGYQTGGGPIYGTVTEVVEKFIPDAFYNFLSRAAIIAGVGAIGGAIGGAGKTEGARSDNADPRTEGSGQSGDEGEKPMESEENESNESKKEPKESGNEPKTAEEPEAEPTTVDEEQARLRSDLSNRFNNLPKDIRDELIDVMSSTDWTTESYQRIRAIWNRIDADTQNSVREFESTQFNSAYGQALRNFLLLPTTL